MNTSVTIRMDLDKKVELIKLAESLGMRPGEFVKMSVFERMKAAGNSIKVVSVDELMEKLGDDLCRK